ncbi:MAG: type II secretion system F family protein [Patescibacteria group bacterium]|nr:type II secretion system F family protein [Patescibacteria group bacterium]
MKFVYKARTRGGEVREGILDAPSQRAALDVLEKYGLYVTYLSEGKKKKGAAILSMNISFLGFLRRVPRKELTIFTKQVGVMLKSAIPPLKTLRAQVAQTKNTLFREAILKIAEGVEAGNSLSQAFSLHPDIFDSFYVNILKSGEVTGKVADSFAYLADHLEREYNLQQKVKGAMIYPVFIIAVFIGAFFLVMFFIIPKLVEVMKAFSGKLPLSTRMLMAISDFVRKGGWIIMFALVIAIVIVLIYSKKTPKVKNFYDKLILRIPALNTFFKKLYLVRFCENLSVLISAGLPITQALGITRDIISSSVYKGILAVIEDRVSRGEKISAIAQEYPLYITPFVAQMIATGEETGRLESVLMDVVHFYQKDIERASENLMAILEPALILVLGVGIAVLAVSVFLPLYQMGAGGMGGGV